MNSQRAFTGPALAAILAVALGARLYNIGFGLPSMYDPDEPIFMITALRLLGEGTLNPAWFGHPGTTTIYLIALIDAVVALSGIAIGAYADVADFSRAAYGNPALLFIPARVAMALLGTGCVLLIYLIGKRLGSQAAGLIAAALLAVNALHIEWSQVIRTDIHAGFFLLGALWFALKAADQPTARAFILAGCCAGLAIATKWPTAVVALALPGAYVAARHRAGAGNSTGLRPLLAGLTAVPITLFLASPFLLLDWATVLANVGGEMRPGHLSQNGTGLVANVSNYLVLGVGIAGCLLSLAGAALAVARYPTACWTLVPVALAFLMLIASHDIFWPRWVLPVLPLLCLFIAIAIVEGRRLLLPAFGAKAAVGAAACALLIVGIPTVGEAIAKANERANDTRAQAVEWAVRNIPAGSTVVYEHLELKVRERPWTILFPVGNAGCIDGADASRRGVKFKAVQKARSGSTIVNLGTLPPGQVASCRADYAILTYFDRYLAERSRYPGELASYAAVLEGGRTVAMFRPNPGKVGGPIVRIVKIDRAR